MVLDLAMSGDAGIDHEAGAKLLNSGQVNPTALTEFLVGRHPKRVRAAKAAWEAEHDDSLVDKICDSLRGGDFGGSYLTLCLRLLKGRREVDDEADEPPVQGPNPQACPDRRLTRCTGR